MSKIPSKKASQYLLAKRLFTPKTQHFHLSYTQSNRSLLNFKNNALRTAKLHISSFIFSPDFQPSNRIQISIDHHTISHLKTIHSLEVSICYHSYQDAHGGLRSYECPDCLALYTFVTQKNLPSSLKSKNQLDLFTALKKLKSLKKLVFNFASADSLDIKKIFQAILASKILAKVSLVLRLPQMTNIQANTLASSLPSFHRLCRFELDLGNNGASSKTLNAILSSMKRFSQLKEWHFVFEKLSMIPAYLHCFQEAVKNMKNLTALRLNFTSVEFIRTSNEDLGEGLMSLKNLKMLRLNMVKCQFPQRSIKSLGNSLGQMNSLRKLDINLASSNLESRSVTEFMETMKGLEMLEEFCLKISYNKLDDYVMGKIVDGIKGYKKLEKVTIAGDSCGLSDKGIKMLVNLPKIFEDLKEMQLLFSANRLIKDEGVRTLIDVIIEGGKKLEKLKVDFRVCSLSKEFQEMYMEKLKERFPEISKDCFLFGGCN